MTARPQLRPGLRRVWRDATTVQLGVFPGPGVVLTGLRAGDDALLAALDGAHDLAQLGAVAARNQVSRRRLTELVDVLERAHLLVDPSSPAADRGHLARVGAGLRARLAPDVLAWSLVHDTDGVRVAADRLRRRVLISGAGRVGSALATTLSAAGVGTVVLADAREVRCGDVLPAGVGQADVGSPWPHALAAAQQRIAGSTSSGSGSGPPAEGAPDVVVLVGEDVLDSRVGEDLVRRDIAHLGVLVSVDRVVVGPLVRPGSSACLRCLDLHRRDRDPAWPHLVAQLLTRRSEPGGLGETALSTTAAGLAALQVLAQLDGISTPDAVGRTLELSLPQGAVQRRRWRRHAACGCARLPEGRGRGGEGAPPIGSPARTGPA